MTPDPGRQGLKSMPCSVSATLSKSPGTAKRSTTLKCEAILTVGPSPVGERLHVPAFLKPAEDPDEQPLRIPEGVLLALCARGVGPAAKERAKEREQGESKESGSLAHDSSKETRQTTWLPLCLQLRIRGKGRIKRGGIYGLGGGRCRARQHGRQDQRQPAHQKSAAQSDVHVPLTNPFLYSLTVMPLGRHASRRGR